MKFSFPTAKEGYFEFGLEKNGFRNKKSKPATEKLVEELDVCTRYALLKIEEPTPSEEKALFLMEKILLRL